MNSTFQRFAALSEDLFATASTEGHFTWVSSRWTEVLGWSEEVLLATPFLDFVHPDDVEGTLAEVAALSTGKTTIQFVNRYRCHDASWRWLEWTTTPVDGILYATARDITARRRRELDERRHAGLLEMALEMGRIGFWRVDLVENCVFWSPEVYAIHGRDPAAYTPSLAEGIEAYHPDDQGPVAAAVQQAIDQRVPFDFERRIVRPTGEVRLIHSWGRPEVDEAGDVVGIIGVFRDITDDARVRRQEELEQFAFVASHDLKEPLRTITTYLSLLEEEDMVAFGDGAEDFWRYVQDAASRMGLLVDDLLHYARAGRPIAPSDVDLAEVVATAIRDLAPRIEDAEASIEVGELPVVKGDATRLGQVMQNLLSNALKFRGEAPLHVSIDAQPHGTDWEVQVVDNGRGFDPDDGEKIFRPFKRLDASRPGTGIGLAVVRRIVHECGGKIWASGTPGAGARFYLRFPAGQRQAVQKVA